MKNVKLQPLLSDPQFKSLVVSQLMRYGEVVVCSDVVDGRGARVKMSYFVSGLSRFQPNIVRELATQVQQELSSAYKEALYHQVQVRKLVAV